MDAVCTHLPCAHTSTVPTPLPRVHPHNIPPHHKQQHVLHSGQRGQRYAEPIIMEPCRPPHL